MSKLVQIICSEITIYEEQIMYRLLDRNPKQFLAEESKTIIGCINIYDDGMWLPDCVLSKSDLDISIVDEKKSDYFLSLVAKLKKEYSDKMIDTKLCTYNQNVLDCYITAIWAEITPYQERLMYTLLGYKPIKYFTSDGGNAIAYITIYADGRWMPDSCYRIQPFEVKTWANVNADDFLNTISLLVKHNKNNMIKW